MTTKTKILASLSAIVAFFSAQFVLMTIYNFGKVSYTIPSFWAFSAVTIIGTWYSYIKIAKYDGLHERKHEYKYRYTLLAIIAYYGFITASAIILMKFGIMPQTQENQSAINDLMKTSAAPLVIYVTVLAPIIEELLFRYIIPKVFRFNAKRNWFGYGLGLLLFILLHAPNGIYGAVSYTGMGLMFTFMRVYYDNINASILTHITWNGIVVLLMLA